MKRLLPVVIVAVTLMLLDARARADNSGFIYAYALHDSHARDSFFSLDAFKPVGPSYPVRPYFELLVQRDSRQVSGLLPQTLNDNYGLLAGGMQLQDRGGSRLFAQVGETIAFGPQPSVGNSRSQGDFRGGLELYRNWTDPSTNQRRGIGSLYGSAVYYSRYENEIVFVQAERGHEFGPLEHPTQVYARLSGDADTRRFFYNNTLNFTAGARFLPLGHLGPSLALEESYNTFLGPLGPVHAAGYERQYFSFRPVVSFGASF